MREEHLYRQIAESIRRDILHGDLKAGDRMPSVREMCARWGCTPGTVQRAYQELARSGLLISRAGQGTQVAGVTATEEKSAHPLLRRVGLIHRAEGFLLEVLTNGYELDEVQEAFALAMDRWRTSGEEQRPLVREVIRFSGSHDPLISGLTSRIEKWLPGVALDLQFSGSLSGLYALKNGTADVAGCHLWDIDSEEYNLPFIRSILYGQPVRVVTVAHRNLGLIVYPGNPLRIHGIADLARPNIRFVNRQEGSGTRVWLDHQLSVYGLEVGQIQGYSREYLTHTDVARQIAEGLADVGVGLESAAVSYGLDFVFLTRERYDLVFSGSLPSDHAVQRLEDWMKSEEFRRYVSEHRGYDASKSGTSIPMS